MYCLCTKEMESLSLFHLLASTFALAGKIEMCVIRIWLITKSCEQDVKKPLLPFRVICYIGYVRKKVKNSRIFYSNTKSSPLEMLFVQELYLLSKLIFFVISDFRYRFVFIFMLMLCLISTLRWAHAVVLPYFYFSETQIQTLDVFSIHSIWWRIKFCQRAYMHTRESYFKWQRHLSFNKIIRNNIILSNLCSSSIWEKRMGDCLLYVGISRILMYWL